MIPLLLEGIGEGLWAKLRFHCLGITQGRNCLKKKSPVAIESPDGKGGLFHTQVCRGGVLSLFAQP